ncbi:MAG: hypothetical protein WC569_02275 [Candidatus Omnitrophota bacterium]
MPPETCENHTSLVADIAVIKTDIKYIKNKVCSHIDEGEKSGGFRDRLIVAEQAIDVIKKGYWKSSLVAGLIGGLLGKISPDIFDWLVKAVFAQH